MMMSPRENDHCDLTCRKQLSYYPSFFFHSLMSISNMLTIYMQGLPTGKVSVLPSGGEKGNVSMVMSPVINGSYDIPILPDEGFLNITKNTGSLLSGSFEAKAVDDNKNNFLLTGIFLNVTVTDSDKIK
jgi:hypothetical protein